MDFKPADKTIKDLLISGHQFMIPRFQRAYSWERRHYSEFLKDIVGNLQIKDGAIVPSSYFLGTMLFIGSFIDADGKPIDVVDGQQRLTTITILFSALSDIFKASGQEMLAQQVFKYIMTKDDNGDDVRVLKSKSSYPYFAYFIQDYSKANASLSIGSEEESNIKSTYDFFVSQLQEDNLRRMLKLKIGSDLVDGVSYIDILKALRDQVLACSFIAISTETKEQSNRIFEILNAKGKRLDGVDLIKNLLFEVACDIEPVDVAEDLWNNIREKIEDPDMGVGIATFYRHFWAAAYKKSTANRLYEDFKSTIKPKSKERYTSFLKEMQEYADYYSQIVNPSLQYYNNRQEYAWLVQSLADLSNSLNIVQVRIPLLALLQAKKRGVISSKLLKSTVNYLEGFHFAYSVLTGGRANRIESAISTFAIGLHNSDSKQTSQTLVEQLLKKLDRLYPSFDSFKDSFVKLSYTKASVPTNVLTKYALRRLYCLYCNQEIIPTNLTVEHIVPESEGHDCCNVGNLILLESDLNGDADDLSYVEKKPIYRRSRIDWVTSFIHENDQWGRDSFSDRAEALAKDYYEKVLGRSLA